MDFPNYNIYIVVIGILSKVKELLLKGTLKTLYIGLFQELKILKFVDISIYNTATFMYNYVYKHLPQCLDGMFIKYNNDIHNYNTRHNNNYVIPSPT